MRKFFTGEGPNAEYINRESQGFPDLSDQSGRSASESARALAQTPIGEPSVGFDVRCIYDSRPTNGYDFNMTNSVTSDFSAAVTLTFSAPLGYRVVPRLWQVTFSDTPAVPAAFQNLDIFLQNNGADVPYNHVLTGFSGTQPIQSFYLVEEESTFGIRLVAGSSLAEVTIVVCNVYGNLIPRTSVALPFEVTNRKL